MFYIFGAGPTLTYSDPTCPIAVRDDPTQHGPAQPSLPHLPLQGPNARAPIARYNGLIATKNKVQGAARSL